MASLEMIARLADLREYDELCQHYAELKENEIKTLAWQTFKLPEEHGVGEWERLKARWHGIDEVLNFPAKQRKQQRKDSD